MKSLVDKLDRATQQAGGNTGNIYVVYLKNADAVKLAAVLRAAYTTTGAGAGARDAADDAHGRAASRPRAAPAAR